MQIHKYLEQFQWYLEHIADIKEESVTLEQRATLGRAECNFGAECDFGRSRVRLWSRGQLWMEPRENLEN